MSYNNFYEFTTEKEEVAAVAKNFKTDGWQLVARLQDASGRVLIARRLWLGRTQTRIIVLRIEGST